MTPEPDADPVQARRARIALAVKWALRAGYLSFLVAIAAFAAGFVTGFDGPWAAIAIAGLVTGCAVLPVPIVLGYGIRAAEREERSGGVLGRAGRRSGATRREERSGR